MIPVINPTPDTPWIKTQASDAEHNKYRIEINVRRNNKYLSQITVCFKKIFELNTCFRYWSEVRISGKPNILKIFFENVLCSDFI